MSDNHQVQSTKKPSGVPLDEDVSARKLVNHNYSYTPELDKCWGRAAIACAATLISSSMHSSSGFFYVALMREYRVNREEASWPASAAQAMTEGAALVAVALQKKFAILTFGLIGSVMFWSGIIACQWATNIKWMTFTFGFIQGSGAGIVSVAVTVLLMRYFQKYRGTATGIRYAGYSLSSLVYPPVLALLHDSFPFRQVMLLIGGFSLNLTPLVFALRESPSRRMLCSTEKLNKISNHESISDTTSPAMQFERDVINIALETKRRAARPTEEISDRRGDLQTKIHTTIIAATTNIVGMRSGPLKCPAAMNSLSGPLHICHDRTNTFNDKIDPTPRQRHQNIEESPEPVPRLFLRPAYWVIVLAAALADYSDYVFMATIVDAALDLGATPYQADMSIVCSAPSQLFGRTVLPLCADLGLANRTMLSAASYIFLAASFSLFAVARTFRTYAPCAAAVSVFVGCLTTMKHVLAADHFGVEAVPAAWATTGIMVLPMILCNPSVLGFVRDNHGAYDYLYFSLAGLHLVMGIMLLFLRYYTIKRE